MTDFCTDPPAILRGFVFVLVCFEKERRLESSFPTIHFFLPGLQEKRIEPLSKITPLTNPQPSAVVNAPPALPILFLPHAPRPDARLAKIHNILLDYQMHTVLPLICKTKECVMIESLQRSCLS